MTAAAEQAGFLPTPRGLELFHTLNPASGPVGVLMCAPLSAEKYCWARSQAALARHLALGGFPSLRFDHAGTGESDGQMQDQDLGTMAEDIASAARYLRSVCAVDRIVLFGIRFGATNARLALDRGVSAAGVVLIEPVVDGRSFWMDQLRSQQMNCVMRGISAPRLEALQAQAATEPVEIKAELYGPGLARDLEALDLYGPRERSAALPPRLVIRYGRSANTSASAQACLEAETRLGGRVDAWTDDGPLPWTEKPLYEGYRPVAMFDQCLRWLHTLDGV